MHMHFQVSENSTQDPNGLGASRKNLNIEYHSLLISDLFPPPPLGKTQTKERDQLGWSHKILETATRGTL